MIAGVIFDLDGVLLDSMFIWKDLGRRYLESLGVAAEPGLSEILFSMSMEQGAAYLKNHYSLPQSEEQIMQGILDRLQNFYFNEVAAKNGAADLMRYFQGKGIKMVAATSSPREHVTRALKRNYLLEYLEGILTTTEENTSKHQPDIYLKAANILGTKIDETLVFEDSLYALKTAKAAGFMVAGIFDQNGETDQDGMKQAADLYLLSPGDYPKD